jgi:hypothetical protein
MGGKPVKSQKLKIISEIDPIYDSKDWRLKKLRACAYIRVSTAVNIVSAKRSTILAK